MDVLSIVFFIFGWLFRVKGLVITSLVLSSVCVIYSVMCLFFMKLDKKQLLSKQIILIGDLLLFCSNNYNPLCVVGEL